MARLLLIFLAVFAQTLICNTASIPVEKKIKAAECNLPQGVIEDIAGYADDVDKIIDYFLQGPFKGETWKR